MQIVLRILFFVLASILEVEVKADSLATWATLRSPLQYPADCISKEGVCAIRTLPETKSIVQGDGSTMVLGASSALVRAEDGSYQFANGSVFAEAKSEQSIKGIYGDVRFVGSVILSEVPAGGFLVRSLEGSVSFRALGYQEWTPLSPGYQILLQKVDKTGKAKVTFPQAIDLRETLVFLAHINTLPAGKFESHWRELAQTWKSAVVGTSQLHAKLYDRELASQNEQLANAKKRREAQRREQDFYREMMWKKHFQ